METNIKALIISAADELNEEREVKILTEQGAAAQLFGQGGVLDSMALVALVVNIEQRIEDELDRRVTIVSEKAMSRKNSPFLTIGSLSEFVQELLAENE